MWVVGPSVWNSLPSELRPLPRDLSRCSYFKLLKTSFRPGLGWECLCVGPSYFEGALYRGGLAIRAFGKCRGPGRGKWKNGVKTVIGNFSDDPASFENQSTPACRPRATNPLNTEETIQ